MTPFPKSSLVRHLSLRENILEHTVTKKSTKKNQFRLWGPTSFNSQILKLLTTCISENLNTPGPPGTHPPGTHSLGSDRAFPSFPQCEAGLSHGRLLPQKSREKAAFLEETLLNSVRTLDWTARRSQLQENAEGKEEIKDHRQQSRQHGFKVARVGTPTRTQDCVDLAQDSSVLKHHLRECSVPGLRVHLLQLCPKGWPMGVFASCCPALSAMPHTLHRLLSAHPVWIAFHSETPKHYNLKKTDSLFLPLSSHFLPLTFFLPSELSAHPPHWGQSDPVDSR